MTPAMRTPEIADRMHEIDWIRALAVFILICIHAGSVFDPYPPFGAKGPPTKYIMVGVSFFHQWRLVLLFLISGAATFKALANQPPLTYLRKRLVRLLIPLIVGTCLIVPIDLYIVFGPRPVSVHSFLDFDTALWGRTFHHRTDPGLGLGLGHLWFLGYLILYSIVSMPLFLWLRSPSGRTLLARLVRLTTRGGRILLWALPLMLIAVTLRARWPIETRKFFDDWDAVARYCCAYVIGYVIVAAPDFLERVRRSAGTALAIGVATSVVVVTAQCWGLGPAPGESAAWLIYAAIMGLNQWVWAVGILGLAGRHLRFANGLSLYLRDAVYPIFVLHLPVLSLLSCSVVAWPIPAICQFTAIVCGTLSISLALYEYGVKRHRVGRFLFGLRPLKSKPSHTSTVLSPHAVQVPNEAQ